MKELDPVTHEDPAYARGWNDALRRDPCEPGEAHRYVIECDRCGQVGTLRVSVDPQTRDWTEVAGGGSEPLPPDPMRDCFDDGHDWDDGVCQRCDETLVPTEPFVSFGDDIDPDSEPWNCIDCGIALEPGTPPICEECVDS